MSECLTSLRMLLLFTSAKAFVCYLLPAVLLTSAVDHATWTPHTWRMTRPLYASDDLLVKRKWLMPIDHVNSLELHSRLHVDAHQSTRKMHLHVTVVQPSVYAIDWIYSRPLMTCRLNYVSRLQMAISLHLRVPARFVSTWSMPMAHHILCFTEMSITRPISLAICYPYTKCTSSIKYLLCFGAIKHSSLRPTMLIFRSTLRPIGNTFCMRMQSAQMVHRSTLCMHYGIDDLCIMAMPPCIEWDVLYLSSRNGTMILVPVTLVSKGVCQRYHFPSDPSVYLIHPLDECKRIKSIRTLVNESAQTYVDLFRCVVPMERNTQLSFMTQLPHTWKYIASKTRLQTQSSEHFSNSYMTMNQYYPMALRSSIPIMEQNTATRICGNSANTFACDNHSVFHMRADKIHMRKEHGELCSDLPELHSPIPDALNDFGLSSCDTQHSSTTLSWTTIAYHPMNVYGESGMNTALFTPYFAYAIICFLNEIVRASSHLDLYLQYTLVPILNGKDIKYMFQGWRDRLQHFTLSMHSPQWSLWNMQPLFSHDGYTDSSLGRRLLVVTR